MVCLSDIDIMYSIFIISSSILAFFMVCLLTKKSCVSPSFVGAYTSTMEHGWAGLLDHDLTGMFSVIFVGLSNQSNEITD